MQVGGSFPINIARAYNLAASQKAAQVGPVAQATPAKAIEQLIAGKTNQPMRFDGGAGAASVAGPALQLYTRAADRIEAAVGVALGKSLDVRG